ncbi:MAG: hypothetical protein ACRDHZ_13920 [Ktedonobacteraceae bacterium]
MTYYRIATQEQQSTAWEWQSKFVKSLEAVFRLGQQYDCLPAKHIRIFAASTVEYLDALLVRINQGLTTNSLTLEQLLHDHQNITTPHVRYFEIGLGWQEDAAEPQELSLLDPASEAPAKSLERAVDADFALDQEPWGGNHDEPYIFTLPDCTSQDLVWVKLRMRMQVGELIA